MVSGFLYMEKICKDFSVYRNQYFGNVAGTHHKMESVCKGFGKVDTLSSYRAGTSGRNRDAANRTTNCRRCIYSEITKCTFVVYMQYADSNADCGGFTYVGKKI